MCAWRADGCVLQHDQLCSAGQVGQERTAGMVLPAAAVSTSMLLLPGWHWQTSATYTWQHCTQYSAVGICQFHRCHDRMCRPPGTLPYRCVVHLPSNQNCLLMQEVNCQDRPWFRLWLHCCLGICHELLHTHVWSCYGGLHKNCGDTANSR